MRNLILAGAAALTFASAPQTVMAQPASALTPEQRGLYDAWPAERRTSYDAWPGEYQAYYWTLTPSQQRGWWALTDEQRAMIHGMTPDQRTAAWQTIEAQMGNAAGGAATVPPAANAAESAVVTNYSGNMTPPPASAMNKTYPVCKRGQTDNCQNAGEGGAPGRSRALNHWPGQSRGDAKAGGPQ